MWETFAGTVVQLRGVLRCRFTNHCQISPDFDNLRLGQRLMGETQWEKGVETASCVFLRFPAVFCGSKPLTLQLKDQICKNLRKAKVFDKLPFLPFSLSQIAVRQACHEGARALPVPNFP